MVHTAVVLPLELLGRLKEDAERSGRGLSTEIRERLKFTYAVEGRPCDPETMKFGKFIKNLASSLAVDLGKKWHESQYAFLAFKYGVAELLAPYDRKDSKAYDINGHLDQPEAVGRIHARLVMRRGEQKE
jgi:hypothetical protein